MNLYRVTFEFNEAVSTEQIYIPHYFGSRLQDVPGEPAKKKRWLSMPIMSGKATRWPTG
jgi:hypothetical protein